ncbi:MAG: DUF4440 domain-containing protein [Phycisphaerales bacterium]|nr:MAG: DUF4440 domain-containing protein [Phycisphaerales bacterium]
MDRQGRVEDELRAVLSRQVEDWNSGRIDRFMDAYWKSEALRFCSGGTITRGWQATLDRYHERYQTRDQMGRLSFDGLEFDVLSGDAALVVGQWQVQREKDEVGGIFTLVFRRIDGRWVIVHDHTSTAAP